MEIRRSYDRLISTMGFPILVTLHLYIESGPWISNINCYAIVIKSSAITNAVQFIITSHSVMWKQEAELQMRLQSHKKGITKSCEEIDHIKMASHISGWEHWINNQNYIIPYICDTHIPHSCHICLIFHPICTCCYGIKQADLVIMRYMLTCLASVNAMYCGSCYHCI